MCNKGYCKSSGYGTNLTYLLNTENNKMKGMLPLVRNGELFILHLLAIAILQKKQYHAC
jgi:hypothetical protein